MNIFDVLIIQPIFNLLISIYAALPWADFGIAIIIFTLIVRILMFPLLRRQLHQAKAMRKLQPELVKIKKSAKGNRQLEAMQMMELYKRHGVSPFRSIGILLIQLPIFIGLFFAVRTMATHREDIAKFTYDFLESIVPIKALINDPDTFNRAMLGFIDSTNTAFTGGSINIWLVLLAVIVGVTQYYMTKQTMVQDAPKKRLRDIMKEAAEGKDADQAEINAAVMGKMMKVMPFFIGFVMLSLPGAIVLYSVVSNVIALLQQRHILNEDVDEMEEIAEQAIEQKKTSKKSSTTKQREKAAKEAHVTRIVAKPSKKKKKR